MTRAERARLGLELKRKGSNLREWDKAQKRKPKSKHRIVRRPGEHATRAAANVAAMRKRQRIVVLTYYGPTCRCCGEHRDEFLAIDHKRNDGAKHRRENKITNIYSWLISNNFPKGFQVLCHNCNMAKGFYGQCPHQTERAENTTREIGTSCEELGGRQADQTVADGCGI